MKGFISFFLRLTNGFTVILKRHVMVIYLFFGLFWVGAVVAQPSIIESPEVIHGNEMTELSNGGLQIRESGFKESILVLRPASNDGVERTKLGKNGAAELSGSGVVSIKSNVGEASKNGDESAENGDDWLYQFSIILVIVMNIFFLSQLNAQRKVDILFDALYCVKWDNLLLMLIKVYNKIILLLIFSAA